MQLHDKETKLADDISTTKDAQEVSFAETALRLGGKSDDEAKRTGAIDTADDQVDQLFKPQYQTINSPVHRAIWDKGVPIDLFTAKDEQTPGDVAAVMDQSIEIVRKHRRGGTILDNDRKVTNEVFEELAGVGYWGLLVDKKYPGLPTSERNATQSLEPPPPYRKTRRQRPKVFVIADKNRAGLLANGCDNGVWRIFRNMIAKK